MRRVIAIGLTSFALTLLCARPAAAQWSWFRWIQELSGPGDFQLNGVTVTFGCAFGTSVEQSPNDESSAVARQVFCDKASNWRSVSRFMGVTYASGDGTNPLEYPPDREKLERVKAQVYLATGVFRADAVVDVGASGGFMRFEGTPEVVVTRFLIEPFVAVRPIAIFVGPGRAAWLDRLARAVELNGALIVFPQGFRLSDFGAIGGADLTGNPETIIRFGFRAQFVF